MQCQQLKPVDKQKRGNKGFTLIEILIGVAILGTIVGISVPGIMDSREKGRSGARAANVKTLTDANWRLQISGEGNDITKSGNDKQAALDYYVSRNVLADRGSGVSLDGLVFSNGIWGTTSDLADHFIPPVTNPLPDGPSDPNPNQTFLDLLGPIKIDGQDVQEILGDLNGPTIDWVFTDPATGESRTNKVGSWDASTGTSSTGGGVAGDSDGGGYFYGSGTVPSTIINTNYNDAGEIIGVSEEQVWSGGPTSEVLGCEQGRVTLTKRLMVSENGPPVDMPPAVVYGTVYGGGTYKIGSLAYAYAVPQSGWRFARWRGSNGRFEVTSRAPLMQIPVSDCNMTFAAEFFAEPPDDPWTLVPPPCS